MNPVPTRKLGKCGAELVSRRAQSAAQLSLLSQKPRGAAPIRSCATTRLSSPRLNPLVPKLRSRLDAADDNDPHRHHDRRLWGDSRRRWPIQLTSWRGSLAGNTRSRRGADPRREREGDAKKVMPLSLD
jgi:hypothetical protein